MFLTPLTPEAEKKQNKVNIIPNPIFQEITQCHPTKTLCKNIYIHLYQMKKHHLFLFFFKLGFTPCKAEQPLKGMELKEKEVYKY